MQSSKEITKRIPSDDDSLCTMEAKKRFEELHEMVEQARKDKKIFSFVACNMPTLRRELKKRGYIEKRKFKLGSIYYSMPMLLLLTQAESNSRCEHALMSRMLGACQPGIVFIWNPWLYNTFKDAELLNKLWIRSPNFAVKNGLCRLINKMRWLYDEKEVFVNHPRSYSAVNNEDTKEFLIDYKLTVAISIVMFLSSRKNIKKYFSKTQGTIYYGSMEQALNIINFHIDRIEGMTPFEDYELSETQFDKLERLHENLVKRRQLIMAGQERAHYLIEKIKYLADEIRHYWPERVSTDGFYNTWLLKPAFFGQGFGIVLADRRDKIIKYVTRRSKRYIIQKYIERPLLVHKTKFDLRQYFLITNDNTHFRSWAHSLVSVKFASHEFTFNNLNKAVHITNFFVQRHYKKTSSEENPLPEDHIWSLDELKNHFEKIGRPNAWDEVFESIKKQLRAISLVGHTSIDKKPGRFELFGVDWIILENFTPYLLEINRGPALCSYTPVWKHVVGTVLTDLVKGKHPCFEYFLENLKTFFCFSSDC